MKSKSILNRKNVYRKRFKGQSIAIVGVLLAFGVLIGLVAIAFDGGSALLQRRAMQNAADAGVLTGGDLLAHNLAASCNPAPCHPTYFVTNQQLRTQVETLVTANRGGAIGATAEDYSTIIEYHYMQGAPSPCSNCYQLAPVNPIYPFVPEFVDGIRVTASVNNPTLFARAIPSPLSNLHVSALAAVRLFATCAPESMPGETLPFTRFRPALEKELFDPNGGNSICHPFPFWTSQPDVGSSTKNVMSFNHDSLYPHDGISQQMITDFDDRAGPENGMNPPWPDSGLSNYNHANINTTFQHCTAEPCVNLYNAGAPQGGGITGAPTIGDLGNWIFWQWRGTISTNSSTWNGLSNSMTLYPSTRQNGAHGTNPRPGDWSEMVAITGGGGNNIQEAVHDLADQFGFDTPFGLPVSQGGLNWGKAIARDVYVWGEEATDKYSGLVNGDDKSAQAWESWDSTNRNPCSGGQSNTSAWTDVEISGTYGNNGPNYTASNVSCGNQGSNSLDRVRYTKKYGFLFFANLQGNNYGAVSAPSCPSLPNSGSAAWGILPDIVVPPPPPGSGCSTGWEPGGGVYSQPIDPDGP